MMMMMMIFATFSEHGVSKECPNENEKLPASGCLQSDLAILTGPDSVYLFILS